MKQCKNCRFYNNGACGISNAKKSPNTSGCPNWTEYRG